LEKNLFTHYVLKAREKNSAGT